MALDIDTTLTLEAIDTELTLEAIDELLLIPAPVGGYFDLLMMPSALTSLAVGGPYQIETGHAHVSGGDVGQEYIAGGDVGHVYISGGDVGQQNG